MPSRTQHYLRDECRRDLNDECQLELLEDDEAQTHQVRHEGDRKPDAIEHDGVGAQQLYLKKSTCRAQMNMMRSAHSREQPGPNEHVEIGAQQVYFEQSTGQATMNMRRCNMRETASRAQISIVRSVLTTIAHAPPL